MQAPATRFKRSVSLKYSTRALLSLMLALRRTLDGGMASTQETAARSGTEMSGSHNASWGKPGSRSRSSSAAGLMGTGVGLALRVREAVPEGLVFTAPLRVPLAVVEAVGAGDTEVDPLTLTVRAAVRVSEGDAVTVADWLGEGDPVSLALLLGVSAAVDVPVALRDGCTPSGSELVGEAVRGGVPLADALDDVVDSGDVEGV